MSLIQLEKHVQLLSSTGEILPDSLKNDFSLIVKAQLEEENACHAGLFLRQPFGEIPAISQGSQSNTFL